MSGVWHTRYRNPDPEADHTQRWRSAKDSDTHLYNPTLAGPGSSEVWLVEGEFDALTLILCGIPGVVAIPGTSHTERFKREWKLLFDSAFVVVMFDNDQAGNDAASVAARAFAPRSAILQPPEGMDVNEYWLADPEGMQAAIAAVREENGLV